jgi:two-component system, OmpR family, phosphate regulon sensor histidine kinase PhoR
MKLQLNITKTGVVFTLVTLYIIAAFGWWTIAHVKSSNKLYQEQLTNIELLCYKATLDVNGAISQEIVEDTVAVSNYLKNNFPQLEIIFDESLPPMDNFLIRPTRQAYAYLAERHDRTVRMYALEGLVMMFLLFWGIIWIYNNLQNKLKLKRQQSNFLLSVTHELKTPLASIKLYLETLQKRNLEKDQAAIIIDNSLADAQRLRDLVENVLLAAQLDANKHQLQFFEINLSQVIRTIVDRFATPRGLHQRIHLNLEHDVFLTTDENAIESIISNLLSNAVKYSAPDSPIDISLKTDNAKVLITVADQGQGISPKEKERIFSKFYRIGDEGTRKTKGTGLGLFIVKNLLNLMQGEIKLKDNANKGTIFELSFKKDA